MTLRPSFVCTVLAGLLFTAGPTPAQNATESQTVSLSEKLQIPGATLKPGEYTFVIEDRLQDRAIVRITAQDQSKHFLVLTVPSSNLGQPGSDGLVRFRSDSAHQVLRGWACTGCASALEFVYPKLEAVKLTDQSTEPVLAVDPTSDKLPANLSPDDMKVVTLWLLSPERITASNKGKGVKAEKYASAPQPAEQTQTASVNTSEIAQSPVPLAQAPATQVTAPASGPAGTTANNTSELAQVPAPARTRAATATPTQRSAVATTEVASSAMPSSAGSSRLPKTASNDYLYVFGGLALIVGGLGVRFSRGFAGAKQ